MLPLLILAVIATPLVEIAVVSQLLVWAPWPLVLALAVAGTATGLVVLRQDGLAHLQRWRTAHRRGGAADAVTITEGLRDVAGILLAIPGVVTTVLGLALLAHPLRRLIARGAVAADGSRRRRRLPPLHVDRTPALPPAPPARALEPAPADDAEAAAWDAYALAHAPAGTGHIAGQSAAHDAVADTFFEPVATSTPAPAAPVPPRPPLGAVPQAPPLPAVLPPPHVEPAGDEWGEFMQGRAWEEAPEHRRGKRRRRKGSGAELPGGGAT